ncbi:MAG: pentapeptide repeat-containing protein [Cytophagales bacterium]|nr:pentapeptide repeat-containing protein [Cytophagales bacterium]
MEELLHTERKFENFVFTDKTINHREFDGCIFNQCDLSNSDFSSNRFTDCTFTNCNLSMIKLNGSSLVNVFFKECKLMGINFSTCTDFLFCVQFERCMLDYSSFMNKKMMKTLFKKTTLKEVNFTNTNLDYAIFEDSELTGALFNGTSLANADLLTASNFHIDPELNTIRKAKFTTEGAIGLLEKYQLQIN